MTTVFILLLYVLPMLIAGSIHYFDKTTKTLGDFFEFWWAIFLPFFNIVTSIAVPIYILYNSNWLQRIKDIKIKSVIIIFCSFLLISCGNSDSVKMSKSEYLKLKGLPPERELIVGEQEYCKITTASDNHEYYSQEVGMSGYAIGDIYIHYIDCKFCARKAVKARNKE